VSSFSDHFRRGFDTEHVADESVADAAGIVPQRLTAETGRPPGTTARTRPKEDGLPEVEAHITGTVWKIECEVGQDIEEGDTLVIIESMKMEMPVEAEDDGVVSEIRCQEGASVSEGDTLVILE
jgi:acetyl-CoA carboxylase biotin carboxyl carrier protein